MHSTFCYIFGLWHAGMLACCTKNFCKPRKSLCTQQKRIQFPWSFYDRVIRKTFLDHDVIKAMEFSTKLFKEFKNLITFLVYYIYIYIYSENQIPISIQFFIQLLLHPAESNYSGCHS